MAEQETTTTKAPKTKVLPATTEYWTVGRRKGAIARIKLVTGKGDITINDQPLEKVAPHALQKAKVVAPLVVSDRLTSFDISIRVNGGGTVAQLDAMALGIARALLQYDKMLRPTLRQAGLLTRDARVKERKKYGLKRARKKPQFSKR